MMQVSKILDNGTLVINAFEFSNVVAQKEKSYDTLLRQFIHVTGINRRNAVAHAKGRALVIGSNKKRGRNNKTGSARHGDSRSPLFRGGGVAFGPTKIEYTAKINKSSRNILLPYLVSDYVKNNKFFVYENLNFSKTKDFANFISEFFKSNDFDFGKVLFITHKDEYKSVKRFINNINYANIVASDAIDLMAMVESKYIFISEKSLSGGFDKFFTSTNLLGSSIDKSKEAKLSKKEQLSTKKAKNAKEDKKNIEKKLKIKSERSSKEKDSSSKKKVKETEK